MSKSNRILTYSFIIPVYNEQESLKILLKEITNTFKKINKRYEIIFVDDGSTDTSFQTILKLKKQYSTIEVIRHRANFGKSSALSSGIQIAKGNLIITIDADLQDMPSEIPKLLKKMRKGYELVSGWRYNRNDAISKIISSKLFNWGTSLISGVKLHDFNCGLKVLTRDVALNIPLHGELHRFMPVLAAKRKYRVTEVKILHRNRKFGISKYGRGFGRSWKGIIDLFTAILITDYAAKPAHFFGKIGLIFLIVGFIFDGYVTFLKITSGTTQDKIPLLLAGILFIVVGIQLISTGFIAEIIINYQYNHSRSNVHSYDK